MPKDLLVGKASYEKQEPLPAFASPTVPQETIERLATCINEAERPVICAGGGVNATDASEELTKLAKKSRIPVGTTLMSLGCFDRQDPLSLGIIGMHGQKEANLAVHNCDLLIAAGARFSDRVTGDASRFARDARIVHIDIDRSEIGKNVDADFSVAGDVKDVLSRLIPKVKRNDRRAWNEQVRSYVAPPAQSDGFCPGVIIDTVHEIFGDETIVATDVGQHQMWTA
ncbi:MAG: acetolactate synthase large subunit, partial [Clostridiales Family XIII bacterium]|nr:acetolactate synthase large subunit [Clostridiales Family XIII bacterium]